MLRIQILTLLEVGVWSHCPSQPPPPLATPLGERYRCKPVNVNRATILSFFVQRLRTVLVVRISFNEKVIFTVVGRRIDVIVEQTSGDGRRRSVGVPLCLGQPQLVLVHERGLLARPLGRGLRRHRRPSVHATAGRRRRHGRRRMLLLRGRRAATVRPPPLAATRLKPVKLFTRGYA